MKIIKIYLITALLVCTPCSLIPNSFYAGDFGVSESIDIDGYGFRLGVYANLENQSLDKYDTEHILETYGSLKVFNFSNFMMNFWFWSILLLLAFNAYLIPQSLGEMYSKRKPVGKNS